MIGRRDFLKGAALLPWTCHAQAAAAAAGPMKITKIEAVHFNPEIRLQGVSPNWTWVRLHTDTGLIGIGAEIKPELFKNGDAIVETVAKA